MPHVLKNTFFYEKGIKNAWLVEDRLVQVRFELTSCLNSLPKYEWGWGVGGGVLASPTSLGPL